MTPRSTIIGAFVTATACLYASVGCTGSATIHTMPLLRQDFPATEPPAVTIRPDQAYYWIDEQERLNIALRWHVPSLLGSMYEYDWETSLVLEGMPAGSERLYRLGADALRMSVSHGPVHFRGISFTGVAVIHAPSNGVLRGRFHATVRQQQFNVLTGWSPPLPRSPLHVMAGTFDAVNDPVRGKAIRERTEADGLTRWFGQDDPTSRAVHPLYAIQTRPATTQTKP